MFFAFFQSIQTVCLSFSDRWQGVRLQAGRQVRRFEEEPQEMSEMSLRGLHQGRHGPGSGLD
jgi:hypothetical protein